MFKSLESSPRNFLPNDLMREMGMHRHRSIGLVLPTSPRGPSVGYTFQRPMTPTQFQVMSPRHQLISPTNHTAFAWPIAQVETPRRDASQRFVPPGSPAHWRPHRDAAPIQYPSTACRNRTYQRNTGGKSSTPKFGKWLRDLPPTPRQTRPAPRRVREVPHHMPVRRRQGVEPAPKLGPERYKQMRMDGQRGRSSHNSTVEHLASRIRPVSNGWRADDKRAENTGSNSTNGQVKPQEKKKQSLYKTELCTNWMLTSNCTYGNKCHFAHGIDDLKSRTRPENFKTQPCCDPARDGSRRCLYGSRCNYCHPGEPIRRPVGKQYFDQQYYGELETDFGENKYPFGIYV